MSQRANLVFLDTGPLYAVANRRDQAHTRARGLFSRLAEERAQVVCPTSTLLEFHNLMLHKGLKNAHEIAWVTAQSYLLVYPEEADIRAGLETVAKFSDQGISLTDAVLASMAARTGAKVFTLDERHFSLMGATIFTEESA